METENQRSLSIHIAQLTTLEGRFSVQRSASAATGKVASVRGRVKSLRMRTRLWTHPHLHISGHSLPLTSVPVTRHKRKVR